MMPYIGWFAQNDGSARWVVVAATAVDERWVLVRSPISVLTKAISKFQTRSHNYENIVVSVASRTWQKAWKLSNDLNTLFWRALPCTGVQKMTNAILVMDCVNGIWASIRPAESTQPCWVRAPGSPCDHPESNSVQLQVWAREYRIFLGKCTPTRWAGSGGLWS